MTDEKRIAEIRAERHKVLHRETVDFQRSEIDSPKVDEALASGKHVRWMRGTEYVGTTPAGGTYQVFHGEDVDTLLAALDAERARAEQAEAERDARPDPAALPNLDDHPLQDPAAANRELRKLLYTVDADRKRSDAKVRELATEVWRLRKAMQTPPLPYEYAEDWLNRVEKSRGG